MKGHQNMFELYSIPTRFCQENAYQCTTVMRDVLGKAPACCNANISDRKAYSFMQRLTLLLFEPSVDFQLTRAPSGAWSGSNRYCSATLPAIQPCWRTGDCAWPGGVTPARNAQSHGAADSNSAPDTQADVERLRVLGLSPSRDATGHCQS